jgi:hypothetical protein
MEMFTVEKTSKEKELAAEKESLMGVVKERLGEEYSYGQSKMMLPASEVYECDC